MCLGYTGLLVELEHLKIKTTLIDLCCLLLIDKARAKEKT
jgi:hypothetical protein